jgi:hypothetical protein
MLIERLIIFILEDKLEYNGIMVDSPKVCRYISSIYPFICVCCTWECIGAFLRTSRIDVKDLQFRLGCQHLLRDLASLNLACRRFRNLRDDPDLAMGE